MKKIISYLLGAMIVITASCDGDKNEAGPDVQALLTNGTWKMNTLVIDGVTNNDLFKNLTVSFTTSGFTATNGEPVWPASGTWTFVSAEQKAVKRNDGVEVTVDAVSETTLTLKLNWSKSTLGGGREASIQGNHTFTFSK